jgi:cation transport regulator
MPYKSIQDLPDSVRSHLPERAQKIYKDAFDNAWTEYSDPSKRYADSSLEQTAARVAWSAVKQSYEKDAEGNWVKK